MKRIIYFLLMFSAIVNAQETKCVEDESDDVSADSSQISIKLLPFAFYDNTLGIVFGGFVGFNGLVQKNALAKSGGILSTSGTLYGYLQIENLQLPFFPRIFVRPDFYLGKISEEEFYINFTGDPDFNPGANNSNNDDFVVLSGNDVWLECTFKYLLPLGHGRQAIIEPEFKNGILIDGATGGESWNPFKSGRTFLESKIFYRNMRLESGESVYNSKTFGVELAICHENVDYYFNPTVGSIKRLSYLTDWGAIGVDYKFNAVKLDYRLFIPLYNRTSKSLPTVLALNLFTMDTPSWNDYHIDENPDGTERKVYHRPQVFVSAALGGERKLRSYARFRFYDKSLFYYSAELRKDYRMESIKRILSYQKDRS